MNLGGALMSKSLATHYDAFSRFMLSVGIFSYYLVSKKKRADQNNFYMADPKNE